MAKNSGNNLLKNVAGIAGILIVFVMILRAALTPLYQEVDEMDRLQEQQLARSAADSSGGASSGGGGSSSGENINIDLGGFGGLFNWALGWAWGGPGWYRGPDYGSWGANVWNGWRNWWSGGNNNRVWNGGVHDTYNRAVNNEFRPDRLDGQGQRDFHNTGSDRPHDGGENRGEHHEGAGSSHSGGEHGGRR